MTEAGSLGRRMFMRRFAHSAASVALVPAALAEQAQRAEAEVRIDNFTFSPTPLTVAPYTTVTWTNRDDIPHSIYCESLNLRSRPLDTGDSFSHRFEQPGRFAYICAIHPHMRGLVIVRR